MGGGAIYSAASPSAPAFPSRPCIALPYRRFPTRTHRLHGPQASRPLRAPANRPTVPCSCSIGSRAVACDNVGEPEPEIIEGLTMTQLCDFMIDLFMNKKPESKDWRKVLVFREGWKKYSDNFYKRCQVRADEEKNQVMKNKFLALARKIKKVENEMEAQAILLEEIRQSPTDLGAIIARRREDFNGDFFRYLNTLSESNENLDDRDAMARLGARCLSAVRAYDTAIENLDTLEAAQAKFDEILDSPSLDVACQKIKRMAKQKELDSSLVLLINGSWAAAKDNPKISDAAKNIMYNIYKTATSSLNSIAPPEIKLLKYLLNIVDPEERFSALVRAFSPTTEHEMKDDYAIYSSPKELHKWISIMLDSYQLNKEETDIREARNMMDPVVFQRLSILKEFIEEEFLRNSSEAEEESEPTNDRE